MHLQFPEGRAAAVIDGSEPDKAEKLAQAVMEEAQARQLLLKEAYPFECDGYRIKLSAVNASTFTYVFCLGLTLLPPDQISNDQRTVQFETVAMNAAKAFFGGEELRIGAPWKSEAVPTYENLLDKVAELIPNLGPRLRNAAPDGGDCGWDVLIVKGFGDSNFPRLIVWGNCATGRTDWMKKGMETQPRYFLQSSFAGDARSVHITFFAVPFVMDDDSRLRKLYDQTITFDRFRICEHAPQSSDEIKKWIESARESALQIPLN